MEKIGLLAYLISSIESSEVVHLYYWYLDMARHCIAIIDKDPVGLNPLVEVIAIDTIDRFSMGSIVVEFYIAFNQNNHPKAYQLKVQLITKT